MAATLNHDDVLRELRRRLTAELSKALDKTNGTGSIADTSIIALALVTLALDFDYLTENLHRVGEGT